MRIIVFLLSFVCISAFAEPNEFNFTNRAEVKPSDYLYRQQGLPKDPVFEEYRNVDLGVKLGIGSDCGRVDFKNTLQATLKNILDSKYFGELGKDIIAGSPMLLTCYFSPTWCAILKHSQINANFMSQMRLNQCALMDKYTDSRVQDYYEERQSCVHKEIEKNGGNIEAAMQTCNSSRVWDTDLTNWSGDKFGAKASSNKLIESSAHWAGLDSTQDGSSSVRLVQSLVGDTVLAKGNVFVEYGGRPFALTPRTHLASLERDVEDKLCGQLLGQIDDAGLTGMNAAIRNANLQDITGTKDGSTLDRQTIRNLAVMPKKSRAMYCSRLANSVAVTRFSDEMNRSLDILSVASQNPNLPDSRRKEIAEKRRALKESIDATVDLQKERNSPLNLVTAQINKEGEEIHKDLTEERIGNDKAQFESNTLRSRLFDCADGVMCEGSVR